MGTLVTEKPMSSIGNMLITVMVTPNLLSPLANGIFPRRTTNLYYTSRVTAMVTSMQPILSPVISQNSLVQWLRLLLVFHWFNMIPQNFLTTWAVIPAVFVNLSPKLKTS